MIRYYLRTSFNYFRAHRSFTLINLISLTMGLTICFFAVRYITVELSYDSYNRKANRIFRLVTDATTTSGTTYLSTSVPMGPYLGAHLPEVEEQVRILLDYIIVQSDPDYFREEHLAYADPSLFQIFSIRLVRGDRSSVLRDPFSVVISESAARRYFGTTDCVGERLTLDRTNDATVSGVMEDMPGNSHFRVDMFVSISTLLDKWNPELKTNWDRFLTNTYLLVQPGISPSTLEAKINSSLNTTMDTTSVHYRYLLENLRDVYLKGKPRGSRVGSIVTGDINQIYLFGCVTLFVLFIASFNFVSLTMALAIHRSREVGIRRIMGASRNQLILQFLMDGWLLSMVAFILAGGLGILLSPGVNILVGKDIAVSLGLAESIWWLFGLATITGLLSGIYPALVVARLSRRATGVSLTSGTPMPKLPGRILGGIQFTVSIALIISTLVIYQQLRFLHSSNAGFDRDHKFAMDFHFDQEVMSHGDAYAQQLRSIPGIANATFSSAIPGKVNRRVFTRIGDVRHNIQEIMSDPYFVDDQFLNIYGIRVIAGRTLSHQFSDDKTHAFLVNETMVKQLGYEQVEDILGQSVEQFKVRGTVVGVVNDFYSESPRSPVTPLTIGLSEAFNTYITIETGETQMKSITARLSALWKEWSPGMPMIWFDVKSNYDGQFDEERRFGILFLCLASMAIVITSLGLLGLTAFDAARRTREIGIRKVLGSSTRGVIRLLVIDFIKLFTVALVLGSLLSAYGMSQWLDRFALRTPMYWWYFPVGGAVAFMVAFLAIIHLTLRAARANPVAALRTE